MSSFSALPLGRPVPNRLHAVSCSLPTLEDVRGYEEKRPETLRHMSSGYPRFVVHPLVRRLADHLAARAGLQGRRLWLVGSESIARGLLGWLTASGSEAVFVHFGAIAGIHHPDTPEAFARAKSYLQHIGGFLSSRRAEDELVSLGVLPSAVPEELSAAPDLRAAAWRHLGPLFVGADTQDAFLCSTGMNAIYAAFRAVNELQVRRGRFLWVQLGWLYVDTINILRKFTATPDCHIQVRRVNDRAELIRLFAEKGQQIAGVVAEVPTNPLIQTSDLPWLSHLVRSHGARLILDPSVSSAYSVDLFPHADILVSSLTKYAAHEGDVIAGLAVVNPAAPNASELRALLTIHHEPLYFRDLSRLVVQLPCAPGQTLRMEANLAAVAAFLTSHRAVRRVYWSRAADMAAAFAAVARSHTSCGGLLSFELHGSLQRFHDSIPFAKGPSFGIQTTLLSPFIWLAHYDLVNSEAGRAELAAFGIDPNLVRLSVGTEPLADLLSELDRALQASLEP